MVVLVLLLTRPEAKSKTVDENRNRGNLLAVAKRDQQAFGNDRVEVQV